VTELVFGVSVTTVDIYAVLDRSLDMPRERETSHGDGVSDFEN